MYILSDGERKPNVLATRLGAAANCDCWRRFGVENHISMFDDVVFIIFIIVKKLNSLKHLVRTTVAESHNENSKYEKGAIT